MAANTPALGGVQALQKEALLRMLNIGSDGQTQWSAGSQTWKVLVYDKFCFEVVAPLLKIGSLRNHGVTLNTNIDTERHPVPDLPAVYFVEPTTENIQKICADLTSGLYETCFINFASAVPRPLLQELARGTLAANAGQKVAGVYDRYVSFVSLSSALFSLNMTRAYETLHSDKIADELLESYIERIVDGLLSVLITMKTLPVIRCPAQGPSAMVAQRLEARLRELLADGQQAADLFAGASSSATSAAGIDAGTSQRPMICIMDRDMDIVSMLGHAFTYQALVHDVLSMKLNKLSISVDDDKGQPQKKSYDLDDSDAFWVAHAGKLFPDVTDLVSEAFNEYDRKRREMSEEESSADASAMGGLNPGLAAAINALPEMAEKKRSIDMHTNIASTLKEFILQRDLHEFCWLEEAFTSDSLDKGIKELEKRITPDAKGTATDKARALMVLYLLKPQMTTQQLAALAECIAGIGGDVSGLQYLQHLSSIQSMNIPTQTQSPNAQGGVAGVAGSMLGGLASAAKMVSSQDGFKGIKDMMAGKKTIVICKIMEELMGHKTSEITGGYLYLDPKAPPRTEPARVRQPFKRAIAFVVGGGNFVEMQSLQEWAQKEGRSVTYGSTDIVAAEQFMEELNQLGSTQSSLLSNLQ